MAAKIIVLGSVNGKLELAFQKLATLQQKQNFSFALITGNLFDADQDDDTVSRLLSGGIAVPVSTYFTVGTIPLPDRVVERVEKGEDVCENLHFLGKRSITKTSDGVRIVTLGGALDKSTSGQSNEQHIPLHTAEDAKILRGANATDVLLTTCWPSGVWANSSTNLSSEDHASILSTNEIAELCATIRPRYHFSMSSTDFFYEREPFFHPPSSPDSDETPVTRFISLARFGNAAKAKAMYAFNIVPGEPSSSIPTGSTVSPFLSYSNPRKRPAPADGHFRRYADDHDHQGSGRRMRRRRDRSPPPGPDKCFFCLSNTDVDTHMICSIGEESYVTTAKGPLPSSNTYASSGLTFPGHQLIIPLPHEATLRAMGADANKTYQEMWRFKESMQAMIATKSDYKLGAVTFEISRQSGIHVHWQFIPVPSELIRKGLVEAGFKVEAENRQFPPFVEGALESAVDEGSDFFRLWIWSDDSDTGIQSKELIMRFDGSIRFDLQFGRRVVAKLLGLEDRLHWRDVVESIAEETQDVERFKEAFKPWDFTST
ncbi:CwfJ C-terminus 1-domain-containing protein-like protein [Durotheca rogersii]|uniref:CwfJ C-terminus 1-domain-containing protein-like protein n=1 Tax=Durotheca rogersii TaxID=419775 RepID=UPI00221E7950|nr:CwfJ C-terminus 1-domain-containing protein-like protein [Durotheca rogersii]KAI5861679.1 CwfJ C-terminus 1-domain-containing protein-like protein [Durotheca rogersii]